ncbi:MULTISPECIES: serine protease [unclassified Streptomyces]|uniref:trypsin-like serine peptidase n=1 Tax=unclassified Streptomyces TaxID=2593676 RepID=UPI0022523E8E|nr:MULTISPECIES: trypsin-like peptidase domain-containing protein [unclassified Streptomyces]MCX4527850.1 S1 family peptidase [Streptomyces sp. NBC_01551]MCX4541553.1 S1 family peptidase [Streptomyces sp. NBC_01565]
MSPVVKGACAAVAAGATAVFAVALLKAPAESAEPEDPFPTVGVLMANGEHWCTASVVDSPRGNVVATAAHCVAPAGEDGEPGEVAHDGLAIGELSFAPGFSGEGAGTQPFGVWKVRAVHVDERWTKWGDDTADFAFLTIEPGPDGRSLQEAVGGGEAPKPDWTSGYEREVTVVGYPESDRNPQNKPVSCTTQTRHDEDDPDMLYIGCAGFWTGTSGSPWIADRGGPGEPGRLIGVLSGGETDVDSTAALYDERAKALYDRAARG